MWQVDADELIISLVVCVGDGPSTPLTSSSDVDRLQVLNESKKRSKRKGVCYFTNFDLKLASTEIGFA